MATTFTPLGPQSANPGTLQPQYPTNSPTTANPQPTFTFIPIEPLPTGGLGGAGSFAM